MNKEQKSAEKKEQLKISKTTLYAIIIAVLLTLAFSYVIFKYLPNQQHSSDVEEYKKAFFNAMRCQYSCTLTPQTFNNKTEMLPDQTCTKGCQTVFASVVKGIKGVTTQDLNDDDFVSDLEEMAQKCQQASIIEITAENVTIPQINNEAFFNCVKDALPTIQGKYSYLN